uniref:Glyoxalase/bleomycin resistance protein/dioxygenase n=1 Tax=Rhodopseudomonas palustris (strain BisA53) TaxID=316055 RepID=Q07R07_RHOP5
MIVGMDHVVVLVNDIDTGAAAYQALLGRAPAWRAAREGSQTVLFALDNVSLELMAPAGESDVAERIRAVLGRQGEGLASLCFKVGDIDAMHRRLERLALEPDPVTAVDSRDAATGATLSWRRTRAATAQAGGVRLFFIELSQPRPASTATAEPAIAALDHLVVATADPEAAAALYGARLGLDMALDRSHPEWGRLMFFRCGDLVVEVTHRPGKQPSATRDRLAGLCWRAADLDATRARLVAAGIEVSEVRPGRKPGTKVATVRSHACGVPTLLIQPAPPLQEAAQLAGS